MAPYRRGGQHGRDISAPVAHRARAFMNEPNREEKFYLTLDDSPGVPRLGETIRKYIDTAFDSSTEVMWV
jgi:hypothetical protein